MSEPSKLQETVLRYPWIPVLIPCCGCGQDLDAGPSIAAGWLPLLVQCQDCRGR